MGFGVQKSRLAFSVNVSLLSLKEPGTAHAVQRAALQQRAVISNPPPATQAGHLRQAQGADLAEILLTVPQPSHAQCSGAGSWVRITGKAGVLFLISLC